jgi:hypothetical protein
MVALPGTLLEWPKFESQISYFFTFKYVSLAIRVFNKKNIICYCKKQLEMSLECQSSNLNFLHVSTRIVCEFNYLVIQRKKLHTYIKLILLVQSILKDYKSNWLQAMLPKYGYGPVLVRGTTFLKKLRYGYVYKYFFNIII